MIKQLTSQKLAKGFHFYTLNLEKSVVAIIERIWPKQRKEVAHPYSKKKADWDDFPNERWGDNSSPAYGNLINEVWYSSLDSSKVFTFLL